MFRSVDETKIKIKGLPPPRPGLLKQLGTRNGNLLMVEAGTKGWKPRFVIVKPTTFLYYFDSEEDAEPRGIVDLEYYTKVDLSSASDEVGQRGFRLAPEDKLAAAGLRTYYFDIADKTISSAQEKEAEVNKWIRSLKNHRYDVVLQQREMLRKSLAAGNGLPTRSTQQSKSPHRAMTTGNERSAENGKNQQKGGEVVGPELLETIRSMLRDLNDSEDMMTHSGWRQSYLDPAMMTPSDCLAAIRSAVQRMTASSRQQAADMTALRTELQAINFERQRLAAEVKTLSSSIDNEKMAAAVLSAEHRDFAAKVADLEAQKKVLVRELKSIRRSQNSSSARRPSTAMLGGGNASGRQSEDLSLLSYGGDEREDDGSHRYSVRSSDYDGLLRSSRESIGGVGTTTEYLTTQKKPEAGQNLQESSDVPISPSPVPTVLHSVSSPAPSASATTAPAASTNGQSSPQSPLVSLKVATLLTNDIGGTPPLMPQQTPPQLPKPLVQGVAEAFDGRPSGVATFTGSPNPSTLPHGKEPVTPPISDLKNMPATPPLAIPIEPATPPITPLRQLQLSSAAVAAEAPGLALTPPQVPTSPATPPAIGQPTFNKALHRESLESKHSDSHEPSPILLAHIPDGRVLPPALDLAETPPMGAPQTPPQLSPVRAKPADHDEPEEDTAETPRRETVASVRRTENDVTPPLTPRGESDDEEEDNYMQAAGDRSGSKPWMKGKFDTLSKAMARGNGTSIIGMSLADRNADHHAPSVWEVMNSTRTRAAKLRSRVRGVVFAKQLSNKSNSTPHDANMEGRDEL